MLEESVSIQIGENNSSSTKYCTVHKSCNASMVIKLFQIFVAVSALTMYFFENLETKEKLRELYFIEVSMASISCSVVLCFASMFQLCSGCSKSLKRKLLMLSIEIWFYASLAGFYIVIYVLMVQFKASATLVLVLMMATAATFIFSVTFTVVIQYYEFKGSNPSSNKKTL